MQTIGTAKRARGITKPVVVDPEFYSQLADRCHIPPLPDRPPPVEQVAEGPKLKVVKHGFVNTPHQPLTIDPKKYPRRWSLEGDKNKHERPVLKRGMIVFYHELRYWVERVPASWAESCAVYISDEKVHPDVSRMNSEKRESFCVHADLLTEAPQVTRIGAALPTVASAARQERAKQGIRDVGDEVAVALRPCKDLDAVYKVAAEYLGKTVKELKAKYGHLNPGQQRMNCGNAMRYAWKVKNGLAGRKAR